MNSKKAKRLRRDAALITDDISAASGTKKNLMVRTKDEDGAIIRVKVGTIVTDHVQYPPTSRRAIYQLIKKMK
jgi:hypothetical protein